MEKYPIYEFLKNKECVDSLKEYTHMIFNREIKINNKLLIDPKLNISEEDIESFQVGFKVHEI